MGKIKTVEPLADRVAVEVLPDETVSAGGVILVDTSRERPQRGLVIAVGPGRWFEADGGPVKGPLNEGDVVLFSKYAGTELPGAPGAPTRLVMREADILGREVERDETEAEMRARVERMDDAYLVIAWRSNPAVAQVAQAELEARGMWDEGARVPRMRDDFVTQQAAPDAAPTALPGPELVRDGDYVHFDVTDEPEAPGGDGA